VLFGVQLALFALSGDFECNPDLSSVDPVSEDAQPQVVHQTTRCV